MNNPLHTKVSLIVFLLLLIGAGISISHIKPKTRPAREVQKTESKIGRETDGKAASVEPVKHEPAANDSEISNAANTAESKTANNPDKDVEEPAPTGEAEPAEITYESENENAGTLTIEDINISVNLYKASVYEQPETVQSIVDQEDAAAYFDFDGKLVIADHNNQAFEKLQKCAPGETTAVITGTDGSDSVWVCTGTFDGINAESELLDKNGRPVTDNPETALIMYTCKEDWEHITVTTWKMQEQPATIK